MTPGIDYIGVTVSFYCNDGKGNFLFYKRGKKCRDEVGRWDCGGGQLEFGEDPLVGVLREIKEEFGCDGIIQEQLPAHSVIRIQKGKNTHWLCIPFFVKVNPKDVKNNEPDKIDEIKWFRLSKLPANLHTGYKYTKKRYKKYFDVYKKQK